MKKLRQVLWLIALMVTTHPVFAESVDWKAVQEVNAFTRIVVTTEKQTTCYFVRATDDKLYCTLIAVGRDEPMRKADSWCLIARRFARSQLHSTTTRRASSALLGLLAAGSDWTRRIGQPGLGGSRWVARSAWTCNTTGFTGEAGFQRRVRQWCRSSGFRGLIHATKKGFLKIFGEPGIGYRVGGGGSGSYASTKVLLVWLTDKWTDGVRPYVEIQHRFPI